MFGLHIDFLQLLKYIYYSIQYLRRVILKKSSFPKELTPISRISPDNFAARERELEKIHQRLESGSRVLMGGDIAGNTFLMDGYVEKYYKHYCHILRIKHNKDDLPGDFISNSDLKIRLLISPKLISKEEIFSGILDKLNKIKDSPNLMLLDGVTGDEEGLIRERLNRENWRILSTSRNIVKPR